MYTIEQLITEERFSIYTNYIYKKREEGHTWNEIQFATKGSIEGLQNFLDLYGEDFIKISTDDWFLLVKKMEEISNKSFPVTIGHKPATLQIPASPNSCWVNYKNKLKKDFSADSIVDIEKTTIDIISRLSSETTKDDPVRGMVFGNVQSGKTANMAALISMAADYNYNFFIILTGTIENLRRQTMDRLLTDLNSNNTVYTYQSLEKLSGSSKNPDRLQDLSLGSKHNKYYITVCLKNSTRLKNLLTWLNKDQNKKKELKILLIDDEADQAGINTANISKGLQTTISRYIKNIVFARDKDNNKCAPYKAMNYIGYTATPYGNFLNEASDSSIYPKDFIVALNAPIEYMGPEQFFGIEGDLEPLPLVETIPDEDIKYINENIRDNFVLSKFPMSLKNSIKWFICTIALFRYWKLAKPISMLVHTSQLVENHECMRKQINEYLNNLFKTKDYLEILKFEYDSQKKLLNSDKFIDLMDGYNPERKVKDLPNFNELTSLLLEIKDNGVQNIVFDREEEKLSYGLGIHLCEDNCSNVQDSENIVLRVVYPDTNEKEVLKTCPAFLVIGGQTLSRGLTLQGLTTSYFLRTTSTADTLMQMGRWFGYRIGYELSPRVWLSSNAISMFEHLTILDHELRNELKRMDEQNISPSEYGPRIKYFPDFNRFKVTAKNKMQKAICDITYSNKTGQIIKYYSDEEIFKENYDNTIAFINDLGVVDEEKIKNLQNKSKDASIYPKIWFDVDHGKVINYLSKLKYPYQKASIYDAEKFEEWYENQFDEGILKNWNIMLATVKKTSQTNSLDLENVSINLPKRTKSIAKSTSEVINIMALTNQTDKLADIDYASLTDTEKEEFDALLSKDNADEELYSTSNNYKKIEAIRMKYASKTNPLLIIYIVDKDESGTEENSLKLKTNLVGYYIYIPEGLHSDNYVNTNTVSVELEFDNESDVTEDA